jgi:hypothetical protein
MGRVNFSVEKGFDIYDVNGDLRVSILQGTSVPDGVSGDQASAPIGSLYIRSGTGELYQKIANAGAPSDYEINGAAASSIGNWRPERVDALTNATLSAGAQDPSAWADNDGGCVAADFTVGHYVVGDADGTVTFWEVTNVAAPNITLAAAATPLATDDMVAVKCYLPDPAGQENQAIATYDGSVMVKVADVDFGSATAINLVAPYTPASGDIAAGESVQSAIQKLDGNNDDQDTLLGTAQGDTDLGTFTGVTIPDSSTVKGALQSIETAYEETDANVDDLITLSGQPENSTDLGTFTGVTIPDSSSIKGGLQSIETAYEETDANVDDLITLSGVAENSTDLGTFTGDLISDNTTVKNALQELEVYAEETRIRKSGTVPQSTVTNIDSFLVDDYQGATFTVVIRDVANPANVQRFSFDVLHNGHGAADATSVDDSKSKVLKLGGNFSNTISAALTGTGASQAVIIQMNTAEASGINYTVERADFMPLAG